MSLIHTIWYTYLTRNVNKFFHFVRAPPSILGGRLVVRVERFLCRRPMPIIDRLWCATAQMIAAIEERIVQA